MNNIILNISTQYKVAEATQIKCLYGICVCKIREMGQVEVLISSGNCIVNPYKAL